MLRRPAGVEERSWVAPEAPVPIPGYVPRTDHCVNGVLWANGLDDRFASLFLRRTQSFGDIKSQDLVRPLDDEAADRATGGSLRLECESETLQAFPGGLSVVPAHWLEARLRETDRVIRFFLTAFDLTAGRSMDSRLVGGPPK